MLHLLILLFIFIGLTIAVGGAYLLWLGGSVYYFIAGILLVTSAVLLWRKRKSGFYLYGMVFFGTLVWSVQEVGLDAWALTPRLGLLFVLGGLLFLVAGRTLKPAVFLNRTAVLFFFCRIYGYRHLKWMGVI